VPLREAEELHQLPPHEQIGARLSRQWRLPATLAIPLEHHHTIHDPAVSAALAPAVRTIAEIVGAADLLSRQLGSADDRFIEDGDDQATSILERRGLTPSQIGAVCDRSRVQLDKSKVILSLL
jgi:hypothetical protein